MNPATAAKTAEAPALRELEEREAEIEDAREHVAELEDKAREAEQAARGVVADLEQYYRELGAGEIEPDPEREQRLKAAVQETDADLATKTVTNFRAEDGNPYRMKTVNRQIDAMLEGAREALQQAEQEYDWFIRERFSDLIQELSDQAAAAMKKYDATWAKVEEANEEWWEFRDRWRPMIERSGLDYRFPDSPLGTIGGHGLNPPVPRMILEGEQFKRP